VVKSRLSINGSIDTPSEIIILSLISCHPEGSEMEQAESIDNQYFVSEAKWKLPRKSVTYYARSFGKFLIFSPISSEKKVLDRVYSDNYSYVFFYKSCYILEHEDEN